MIQTSSQNSFTYRSLTYYEQTDSVPTPTLLHVFDNYWQTYYLQIKQLIVKYGQTDRGVPI